MKIEHNDTTLALAGIFQCARLVRDIATRGHCDETAYDNSIATLFKIDAHDVADVFGGDQQMRLGLHTLHDQLSGQSVRDVELTAYVINLVHLERKFSANREMLQQVADQIQQIEIRRNQFEMTATILAAQCAEVYSQTISTLHPRIMVKGDASILSRPDNINRVRALLLAGIRSAMLWRQVGGRRWHLVFRRSAYIESSKKLLNKT